MNLNTLPEGLGEFLGADRFVAVLQLVENPLQCQGNALGGVISLCGHHVHRLGGEEMFVRLLDCYSFLSVL